MSETENGHIGEEAAAAPASHQQIEYLPLDSFIVIDRILGRAGPRPAHEIEKLARTIMERGQQTAVEYVRGHGDYEGLNVLTKGGGRIAAMRLLSDRGRIWPTGPLVKAVLSERGGGAAAALQESYVDGLHENIHRYNLKPADLLLAFQTLEGPPEHLTGRQIAARLDISGGLVSQVKSYGTRIPEVRAAVDSGQLTFRAVRRFAGLSPARQLQLLKKMQKAASRRTTEKAGTKRKQTASAPKKRAHVQPVRAAAARLPLFLGRVVLAVQRYSGTRAPEDRKRRLVATAQAARRFADSVLGPVLPGKAGENKERTAKHPQPLTPPTAGRARPAASATHRRSGTHG